MNVSNLTIHCTLYTGTLYTVCTINSTPKKTQIISNDFFIFFFVQFEFILRSFHWNQLLLFRIRMTISLFRAQIFETKWKTRNEWYWAMNGKEKNKVFFFYFLRTHCVWANATYVFNWHFVLNWDSQNIWTAESTGTQVRIVS